jgi:hypothetical protein
VSSAPFSTRHPDPCSPASRLRLTLESMEEDLDPAVDWIGARQVADILGVTITRVHQLARRDLLPCVRHQGHYYFRRPQVEVVADARRTRWHSGCK